MGGDMIDAATGELSAQLGPDRVPAYEASRRISNGAVEHRPALVVSRPAAAHVQAAVRTSTRPPAGPRRSPVAPSTTSTAPPPRRPIDRTALGLRKDHLVEIVAAWEPGDGDRRRAGADSVAKAPAPYALRRLREPGEHEQLARAYGPDAARLRAAKKRLDPDGVFSATPLPPSPAPGA